MDCPRDTPSLPAKPFLDGTLSHLLEEPRRLRLESTDLMEKSRLLSRMWAALTRRCHAGMGIFRSPNASP
jgi:hypothetical protein